MKGHTEKYNIHTLVWFEVHGELEEARKREVQIKRWRRAWKIDLIMKENPDWRDISWKLA